MRETFLVDLSAAQSRESEAGAGPETGIGQTRLDISTLIFWFTAGRSAIAATDGASDGVKRYRSVNTSHLGDRLMNRTVEARCIIEPASRLDDDDPDDDDDDDDFEDDDGEDEDEEDDEEEPETWQVRRGVPATGWVPA
jgi:hypothetical protein